MTDEQAEAVEQIAFYDAVADDPEMAPDQKIHWLRITAKDYDDHLTAVEPVIAAARALHAECTSGIVFDNLVARISGVFAALVAYDKKRTP